MNPAKGGSRLDDFNFKHSFVGKKDLAKQSKMKTRDIANEEDLEEEMAETTKKNLVDYDSSTDEEEENNDEEDEGSEESDASDNVDELLKELEHKDPVNMNTEFKMKRKWDEDGIFNEKIEAPKREKHMNDAINTAQHKKFMSNLFK